MLACPPSLSPGEPAAGVREKLDDEQFPLSCPQAAPPRRGSAIGRSSILATLEGKSLVYHRHGQRRILCITPFCLYPAGRVQARGGGPVGLAQGKTKLLLSGPGLLPGA